MESAEVKVKGVKVTCETGVKVKVMKPRADARETTRLAMTTMMRQKKSGNAMKKRRSTTRNDNPAH